MLNTFVFNVYKVPVSLYQYDKPYVAMLNVYVTLNI